MSGYSRAYDPDSIQHLVARGNQRQPLFLDRQDHRVFLGLLRPLLGEHRLVAYCLMRNHLHLVMHCGGASLSRTMQRLLVGYARYFNHRYQQVGHVFQGRHYSRVCTNRAYFRELLRYVHLNPVRAGLAARPVDYRWSSLPAYLGSPSTLPVDIPYGLSAFGQAIPEARQSFLAFLNAPVPASAETLFDWAERWVGGRPAGRGRDARPGLERLIEAAAHCLGLEVADLAGWGSRRPSTRGRRVLAQVAIGTYGHSQREVARCLGRSEAAVSRWMRGAEPHLPGLASQIAGLLERGLGQT